jgi:uncharacterized membrane protein YphA (DoxX/SURF4 family)
LELFVLQVGCQLVLGSVFLQAGYYKATHPKAFSAALLTYSFGSTVRKIVVMAVPPFEVIIGTFILIGLTLPISAAIAAFFVVACSIVLLMFRQNEMESCGCIGHFFDPHSKSKLVLRNVVFLSGLLLLLIADHIAVSWPAYQAAMTVSIVTILALPLARHLVLSSRAPSVPAS